MKQALYVLSMTLWKCVWMWSKRQLGLTRHGVTMYSFTMMKISIITNISIFRFYKYIKDIWADILKKNIDKPKID